jgi:hypothetical protein
LNEIRSNITHNSRGGLHFAYHPLEEIYPPDYSLLRDSIWMAECDFLRKLRGRILQGGFAAATATAARQAIEARVAFFARGQANAVGGIAMGFFGPPPTSRNSSCARTLPYAMVL